MSDAYEPPEVLDRVRTERGELVLRRQGARFEIISNGVFLMDTSDGTSERLMVGAAVDRTAASAPDLLIGGLGVGFSLNYAVRETAARHIDVVEIEPAIVSWHRQHMRSLTVDAMGDRRVRVIEADIAEWLRTADRVYDAVCLDTDNGPNWLVFEANEGLYTAAGLELIAARLRPGGALAVWSAATDPAFEDRLRSRFRDVEVLETPVRRGQPDVVYVALKR
jgi:spermidine synthase